ncbi:MAG: MFS transporter [Rhodospirillales bacterium]|jgi:MFS family permease|nr:MFS transporter [Rhodospirillales bacterium]
MTGSTAAAKSNLRNLVIACVAITIFGFTFGLNYPLLSLAMESQGFSENMIGINSAMIPIGMLLAAPIIPRAVSKYGSKDVAIASALCVAIIFTCFKAFPSIEAWFVLRLFQGMAASSLFVLSESWIVKFASESHRGRVVAVYGMALSASFGAGPLMVRFMGSESWLPYLIGSAVVLIGIIPLIFIQDNELEEQSDTNEAGDTQEKKSMDFFSFAPKAPMLLIAVAIFAVYDASTLSLLPVYGIRLGMDMETSATILAALIYGNVIFQLPIGWMADKFPKRAVMAGCAVVTAISLFALPLSMGSIWMWPLLLIAGAFGYGIYSVALASLGDRFSGIELVTGTASFSVVWGIGALVGSVIGGWFMTGFGPHGLPVGLGLIFAFYVVGLVFRTRQLARKAV